MVAVTGRVVITGHSLSGEAVLVSDTLTRAVPLAGPGVKACFLWGRDGIPHFPDDGSTAEVLSPLPPPAGCRVSTLEISPGEDARYHDVIRSALGEMADPAHAGFHRTPTLDVVFVLAGEPVLELDRSGRRLSTGDCVILNGVRHRWSNPGGGAAILLAVQLGANVAS